VVAVPCSVHVGLVEDVICLTRGGVASAKAAPIGVA